MSKNQEKEKPSIAVVNLEDEVVFTTTHSLKNTAVRDDSKSKDTLYEQQSTDLRNICRICLHPESNMVSLMVKMGSGLLADIFWSITSVEVVPEEKLPMTICTSCYNNLISAYIFKSKCIESNNTLRLKLHGKKVKHKKEPSFASKIDKETQTCVDYDNNVPSILSQESEGPEVSCIKLEFDLKLEEAENIEEIEYLEEDLPLIHEIKNSTNVIEEDKNRQPIKIKLADSRELLKEETDKKYPNKRLFSCAICSKTFNKLTTLRTHTQKCRANMSRCMYSCGQCKESFISSNDLLIHSALHVKGNKWICNQCDKEFTDRSRFRRHIRRHMESLRWACEACGKTFAELCALRRHERVHSGARPEKKYNCKVCDKMFGDKSQLVEHSARHTGVRPCSCNVCGKTFPSSRLLASHSLTHSDQRPYQCAFCDKRFRQKSTRDTHNRTHTGEKPFICSTCGKCFIQNSNLRLHMRTHTGEKPYKCDVCGSKFSSGSSLTTHKRTHTGEKPYSCPVCNKRFARTDMRSHMRLHTGERPFACCVCPMRFINAARLRDHNLIHSGETPFHCALCPDKFNKKVCLVKHLKKHERYLKLKNKDIIIVKQPPHALDNSTPLIEETCEINTTGEMMNYTKNNSFRLVREEVPLEVSEEVILQDDSDVKTELLFIEERPNDLKYQNNDVRLDKVNYISNDLNDVNLMTVNQGEINMSSSSVLEESAVKLYQLDESLLQIQTTGRQVTIRKVTSKMTTNF